jgi:hypothetical protein
MRRGDVDRGRLELSIPGTDQRGTAAPAGGIDQALIARRPGRRRSDCASDIGSLRGRVSRRPPAAIARELAGLVWAMAEQIQTANRCSFA